MKHFTFRKVLQTKALNTFFSIALSSITTTIIVLLAIYICIKTGYIPEEKTTSFYRILMGTLCLVFCISIGRLLQWCLKPKAECYIREDNTIVMNNIYNRNKIVILPSDIYDIYLVSHKTLWGIYQNVVINAKSKIKPWRQVTIELPLQEPQQFIDEVEKIRKSTH